ncbi:MAG TPA: sulfate ABC transporter substrate-binding protein [Mycobacteriales bacterium]|nr:sulfate ABC transporter substrate-binding protein [Mycobacteriales bacterium]
MRPRSALLTAAAATIALAATACGSGSGGGDKTELTLVAYSTPQAAYEKIIAAFQQTAAGKNIDFKQSYGASGDQSRSVESGRDADIVAFSLEPDITRLVKDGIVAPNWNANKYHGMVTDSVVSLVVRKGNPKHIKDWLDLAKSGIKVVTPNPFSSGSAQWNIMGAYGSVRKSGGSDKGATEFLSKVLKNTVVQDESGRKALQTFTSGAGDVLISYENEAIFAQQNHQPLDYVIPNNTLLIENPVAVTKNSKHPEAAKKFLNFLYSDTAQKIYAENGYRPVTKVKISQKFKKPSGLFTIQYFGGWPAVTKKFFDPKTGSVAAIEKNLGVSVDKK